jgi:2-dehydro-3-deoxy-D-arabinonate dehydratase
MKIFRFATDAGPRLGLEDDEGRRLDLTASDPEAFASLAAWLALEDPAEAARAAAGRAPALAEPALLAPVDRQEVWAAGVTYERSRQARREESASSADVYDRVYEAERPELFFKALSHRVAGPDAPIRIRADSAWNVPEPELAAVLSATGRIVGYTIGNDVSSRSIEGENPLYLPQAKVYEGACALGPAIALAGGPGLDPRRLAVTMSIRRQGAEAFAGATSTARMRRGPEELAAWLLRELSFPWGAVLLTGTGIVPPEPFTLRPGDLVEISIEGIGRLVNEVSSPGPSPPGSGRPRASPPAP